MTMHPKIAEEIRAIANGTPRVWKPSNDLADSIIAEAEDWELCTPISCSPMKDDLA